MKDGLERIRLVAQEYLTKKDYVYAQVVDHVISFKGHRTCDIIGSSSYIPTQLGIDLILGSIKKVELNVISGTSKVKVK